MAEAATAAGALSGPERVVEIQQTVCNLPRVQTAARWRRDSLAASGPKGFEFTLKAWQLITHEATSPTYRRLRTPIPESQRALYGSFRPTDAVLDAWARTVAVARALDARVVVFQCPARFTPTQQHTENLRAFFRAADRAGFVTAWEPRGEWPPALVHSLCNDLNLVHVVDPLKAPSQISAYGGGPSGACFAVRRRRPGLRSLQQSVHGRRRRPIPEATPAVRQRAQRRRAGGLRRFHRGRS